MTFPEDARPASTRPAAPPSSVIGYVLNVFLPGAGFTYVGRWGWHLGWIGIFFGLNVLAGIVSAVTASSAGLLVPVVGFVAMLVHFGRVYAQQEARNFQPPLELAVKLVLILGHVFVGITLTSILAAVLIPNLLGAGQRASQVWEQSTARMVQTQVAVQQIDGTLQAGPCDLKELPEDARAKITSCTVALRGNDEPAIEITFASGRTISRP